MQNRRSFFKSLSAVAALATLPFKLAKNKFVVKEAFGVSPEGPYFHRVFTGRGSQDIPDPKSGDIFVDVPGDRLFCYDGKRWLPFTDEMDT